MTLGALSSDGSMMIVKPLVYVDTSVAKCETTTSGEKSVRSAISSVRISDDRRSAAKLRRWFKEKNISIQVSTFRRTEGTHTFEIL